MAKVYFVFTAVLIFTSRDLWLDSQSGHVYCNLLSSTSRFGEFASLDFAAGLSKYMDHETKRLEVIKNSRGYEGEVPKLKIRLEKLELLRKQVADRKAEHDALRQKLSDFHPTTALRLISNFLNTWEDKLKNETLYGFRLAEFLTNDDESKLPTRADLTIIARAISEIQFIYNLSTSDIYEGKVMGVSGVPLRPQDAYEIALESMYLQLLKQAASWFLKALNETPAVEMEANTAQNASYPIANAMAKLGILKYGMDEKQKGLELLERATNLDPDDGVILQQYLHRRFGRDVEPLSYSQPGELWMKWFRLCQRAASAVVIPLKWYHVCRYRKSFLVPYRKYKEEIISRSPFLSIIHQFVSAKEAFQLINISASKLQDQAIKGAEQDLFHAQGSVLSSKVSAARLLAERITDLTGMDTTERPVHSSGEPLHVLNYGISGTFFPHQDINRSYGIRYIMEKSGYRMASVLIYLTNVTAGGATAFPYLNITVTPEIGKALLWYNTNPNGDVETDILHAGCTVAVGAKWVASKGVWSWGNEIRHPCGPRKTSSHLAVDKIAPRLV